ncbi:MAG: metallophosphoesterase, partial [Candidatus Krumholzibacteria bacterium]|nr:metallophosphoesterase [Candidatus Krumholzibacteria bacterium]
MLKQVPLLLLLLLFSSPSWAVTAHWISAEEELLGGGSATGRLSDLILENDLLVFIIGAPGHGGEYASSGGNVLDAGLRSLGQDLLGEQYTYFNDTWPRQAVYSEIQILDDGSSGEARVLASGRDSDNASILVDTEYRLRDGEPFLEVQTTLFNGSPVTLPSFELGDAFTWVSVAAFIPGYGEEYPASTVSSWIAASDGSSSLGYRGESATMIGDHGGSWSDMILESPNLPAGLEVSFTRQLIVAEGGVSSVATVVHELDGLETGVLTADFGFTPAAYPYLRSKVTLKDSEGLPYCMMSVPENGIGHASLPPGNWSLKAETAGYTEDQGSFALAAGDSLHYHFEQTYGGPVYDIGDTLTLVQRPLLNIPQIARPGDSFPVECDADAGASDWHAALIHESKRIELDLLSEDYDPTTFLWTLNLRIPETVPALDLYDLEVGNSDILDVTENAVDLIDDFEGDFYFVQITDTHLPTHVFIGETGEVPDSSEILNLRAVIADLNIIRPAFVLLTGDLVNEGELEDYLFGREYTRAQSLLAELEVPVYLTAGNHDLGGWLYTPPPDGTARRDWWRFFGWKRLGNPPPGLPSRTQDYSFDYSGVHFTALESYDNYDLWRSEIYGETSFTSEQLQWLAEDLANSDAGAKVLFYHYDFKQEMNLSSLGVDMALWGHTHRDEGNTQSPPFNFGTNNTCDGERSFRLIRATDTELSPRPTLSSGPYGLKLRAQYMPPNDGNWDEVACQLTNQLNERFEHGRLKFRLPHSAFGYQIEGPGEIAQVDSSGAYSVLSVHVDIQPTSQELITVRVIDGTPAQPPLLPERLRLMQNHPNPFNPRTEIRF